LSGWLDTGGDDEVSWRIGLAAEGETDALPCAVARLVHPGFPGDSVPWSPPSLVVWSSAAEARSKSWAPVSERGSPREPCIRVPPPRERRHGHGLEVRDVPEGPSSRADDELGSREGVQALRRAVSSLSRLPDGGNRAELCQARGLANARSLLPASEWARARENERPPWNAPRRSRPTQRRERTDWAVISEATCQPTILHLVASTRETSAIPSVVRTEVRSETLPACGRSD